MNQNELFIYDEKTGKIEITEFAKKYYKDQGLDPELMAEQWLGRLLKVLDKKAKDNETE